MRPYGGEPSPCYHPAALDMSQFLYRLHPTRPAMLTEGPTTAETRAIEAHAAYLSDLAQAGVVLMAGRTQNTDPTSFGIVVFEAESEEDARRIMEEDPGVLGGVMQVELYPFRIAISGGTFAGPATQG